MIKDSNNKLRLEELEIIDHRSKQQKIFHEERTLELMLIVINKQLKKAKD